MWVAMLGIEPSFRVAESLRPSSVFFNPCKSGYTQHGSVLLTPAVAAGLTDHVWEIEELVAQLD